MAQLPKHNVKLLLRKFAGSLALFAETRIQTVCTTSAGVEMLTVKCDWNYDKIQTWKVRFLQAWTKEFSQQQI